MQYGIYITLILIIGKKWNIMQAQSLSEVDDEVSF